MAERLLAKLPLEAVRIVKAIAMSAKPIPIAPSKWPTKVYALVLALVDKAADQALVSLQKKW